MHKHDKSRSSGSGAIVNDELVRQTPPISVSSASCFLMTGMSWSWLLRFARAHGVPIIPVGSRKQVVAGPQLAAALMRLIDAPVRELSASEELEAVRADFIALRNQRRRRTSATKGEAR